MFISFSRRAGTGVVKPGTSKHNVYAAGVFLGGIKVRSTTNRNQYYFTI